MARDPSEERDAAKTATIAAAALGVLFSVLALVFFSGRAAASVVIGATIAVANLVMLRAIIRAILRPPEEEEVAENAEKPEQVEKPTHAESKAEGRRGGTAWGIFAVIKIIVLFGGVGLLLTKGLVDPIPLVVGYGVLPLGITASALFDSLAPKARRRR